MARPALVNGHPITKNRAMADFNIFRYIHPMQRASHHRHSHGPFMTHLLKLTALPLALALWPSASWASDAANAALQVLLGARDTSQPSSSPSHSLTGKTQHKTITVMRGESLDRVIRRAMPGMPLHPDFLRQAFVRLNPQVFPQGKPHALRTGTTLQIPTAEELRFLLVSQHPETASLFQQAETPSASEQEPTPAQTRRQWVRYP